MSSRIRSLTELITMCGRITAEHAHQGEWQPHSASVLSQRYEAAAPLADVSRGLTRTRRGMRRVETLARQKFHDRTLATGTQPPSP
ncbi:hypothetical protein FNH09_04445 [Streptomyces adustus]|uniref:Uncharacterized protein n=1 Tax=Streptomyces adustus TaxID=1609272 RepID=A0A5N8V9F0_9ACTN|nr:hypothetical protein [Streptomyces adustus]MPY30585.1 hypothetical protein [Streptomyces adustus]